MGQTSDILETVKGRLTEFNPDLAVEFFPDDPNGYRLNHPKGALLIAYPGGSFGESLDIGVIAQDRSVRIAVTTVFRQLNGRDGAVARLDLLRAHLVGFAPAHCSKLRAVQERFLQEKTGVWYYVTLFEADSMQIEDATPETGPLYTAIDYYAPTQEVGVDAPKIHI
jgi:hypothetical protein